MRLAHASLVLSIIFFLFISPAALSAQNLIVNPSFETGRPGLSHPTVTGVWSGDYTAFVTSQDGITPPHGSRMLHFIAAHAQNSGSGNMACEFFQTVDISAYAALIASGKAVAKLSTSFNRVAGDSETDTAFYIQIMAFAGDPSSFGSQYAASSWLAMTGKLLYSDPDTQTWETIMEELAIPSNTDFVGIRISAQENIFNDLILPEFDGHYADDVVLTIEEQVPIPTLSSLSLISFAAALLLIGVYMIRRHRRNLASNGPA